MAEEWYYTSAGQQAGPVSDAELRQLAAAGRLQSNDMVWREGMPQWAPATAVPGLMPEAPARGGYDEPREPRPPRYAERDEDDRRASKRQGRGREEYDRDRDAYDEPEEPRRRRRRPQGMSTGAKVALGLGIGGGVLLIIIVVIVVIVLIANSGGGSNERSFNIPAGGRQTFDVELKGGRRTIVTVRSVHNTDIDLLVFRVGQNIPVAADMKIDKDCRVEFTPQVTGMYRLEVQNISPALLFRDNHCTLKWEQR